MHIMHLAIVKRVNNLLKGDLDKLMIGVLLPNLTTYDHDISHFRKDGIVSDIDVFLDKYRSNLKNDVMLGYFIHLLIDNYFKNFFNTQIITYDEEKNVTGYIFNGVQKSANLETIMKLIKEDYASYNTYLLDKSLVDKFVSDECVKSFVAFDECNIDASVLYDQIIHINMDIDKGSKKSFFKRFKSYKFKVLPRDMYDDLMDKCVEDIVERLKRVTV